MDLRAHWDAIFNARPASQLTWHQPHLQLSLGMLRRCALPSNAAIIDVGCGEATLLADLLEAGYTRLTALDVSPVALQHTRQVLGGQAEHVTWVQGDIRRAELPQAGFDLWHDRAVFHFLTHPDDQQAYARAAAQALKPGGFIILSTFAQEGPSRCSNLDVVRYSPSSLQAALGPDFRLLESQDELHHTPWGGEQHYMYCRFQRNDGAI